MGLIKSGAKIVAGLAASAIKDAAKDKLKENFSSSKHKYVDFGDDDDDVESSKPKKRSSSSSSRKSSNKNLIKCPDCGKYFSIHADCCPECGCPINKINDISAKDAADKSEVLKVSDKNTSKKGKSKYLEVFIPADFATNPNYKYVYKRRDYAKRKRNTLITMLSLAGAFALGGVLIILLAPTDIIPACIAPFFATFIFLLLALVFGAGHIRKGKYGEHQVVVKLDSINKITIDNIFVLESNRLNISLMLEGEEKPLLIEIKDSAVMFK